MRGSREDVASHQEIQSEFKGVFANGNGRGSMWGNGDGFGCGECGYLDGSGDMAASWSRCNGAHLWRKR